MFLNVTCDSYRLPLKIFCYNYCRGWDVSTLSYPQGLLEIDLILGLPMNAISS